MDAETEDIEPKDFIVQFFVTKATAQVLVYAKDEEEAVKVASEEFAVFPEETETWDVEKYELDAVGERNGEMHTAPAFFARLAREARARRFKEIGERLN